MRFVVWAECDVGGLLSGWFLIEGVVVRGCCSVGDLLVHGGVFGVGELRSVAVAVWGGLRLGGSCGVEM